MRAREGESRNNDLRLRIKEQLLLLSKGISERSVRCAPLHLRKKSTLYLFKSRTSRENRHYTDSPLGCFLMIT